MEMIIILKSIMNRISNQNNPFCINSRKHVWLTINYRIAFGFLFILMLIVCIAYTWYNEWQKIEQLEEDNRRVDGFRSDINDIHIRLIEFSLLGETVLDWDDEDVEHYHTQRMMVDSMLCRFKGSYPFERIGSLRCLLENKEIQMRNIVQVLDEQEALNAKIARQVPVIVRKSTQEQPKKPKRKGFLGLFGKKEEPKPTATTAMLHTLNRDMIVRQQAQSRMLAEHTDSLSVRNGELNRQLQSLIRRMDDRVQSDLRQREAEITTMREQSFLQIGGLTGFVLLLLVISYIIIHREANRIKRYKEKTARLISELQESAAQNEELITSRKKAMHTITHELRTPLTAIHGYAELIPTENDTEKIDNYSGNIRMAAQRMIAMLNSLLRYFRLDRGKEQASVAPFKLRTIADTLSAEFTPLSEEKGLRLSVECDTDIIVMSDKERVMQICDNLLTNAVKFTQTGDISVRLSHSCGILDIVVEDTGSGMTEEEQHRVFNAFERLSNAATQDGFGLGLSIVRRIVDMLGGTIRLDSEKGKGSRFTVEIPARTADTVTSDENDVQETHLEKSYSVITLDDNEIVLNMIKDMYASVGVHCDTFSNVGDMMEAIRSRNYDFAIVDLKMPEMNGFEVLELMRSSSVGNSRELPVIVATASGSCDEEELLTRGFTACLFKPFAISELLATSEKCLSANAGKDELPDLTSLLAYGDKTMILDRLITETEKDIQTVRNAVEKNDCKVLDEWVHRLRSSWAVIRADKPLWELYELLHQKEECSKEELQRAVFAILDKGNMIIKVAKEERRESDEDICD